ncbi:hypothetical protein GCM10029978_119510 [Actinoallomurus acanthiterrae]
MVAYRIDFIEGTPVIHFLKLVKAEFCVIYEVFNILAIKIPSSNNTRGIKVMDGYEKA